MLTTIDPKRPNKKSGHIINLGWVTSVGHFSSHLPPGTIAIPGTQETSSTFSRTHSVSHSFTYLLLKTPWDRSRPAGEIKLGRGVRAHDSDREE